MKRKLFALMRAYETNDWLTYLPQIVKNINNTPTKKHGFKPAEVASKVYDQKVLDAMIKRDTFKRQDLHKVIEESVRFRKSKRQDLIHEGDIVQENKWYHRRTEMKKAIEQVNSSRLQKKLYCTPFFLF